MTSKGTPETTAAWDTRLADLASSTEVEDQLCAILMNINVGGFGLYEVIAREKAKAIVTHLRFAGAEK